MTVQYQEPQKQQARAAVLKAAIDALTKDRFKSTLAPKDYVARVRAHLLKKGTPSDAAVAAQLSEETIERWEGFYDSIVQAKNPQQLKVAYLAGPNPENDLEELAVHGILSENVWAFESDAFTYLNAVNSVLESKFPFIKIIKGDIGAFFAVSPQRFDIIYLDFCGPLPSRAKKQRTLSVVTAILAGHSLNSPGVLITNVALPSEQQDKNGHQLLAQLAATYLYPKEFVETNKKADENFIEGPVAHGLDFAEWLAVVAGDVEDYYGQYITRLLMDHVSVISPYDRFPQNHALFKQFFSVDTHKLKPLLDKFFHFTRAGDGGDVISECGSMPLLWTFASLSSPVNGQDSNYAQLVNQDPAFAEFAALFLRQLSTTSDEKMLIERLAALHFLMSEQGDADQFIAQPMGELSLHKWLRESYQFCDLVLFHQIQELLFRQVAVPYHVNVDATTRWSYLAKSTRMFMDMIVVDECRYLYDWMPTLGTFLAGMDDIERQLSYRFALDGVSKHRRWYNPEFFSGTAVIDQFALGFEAKVLKPRVVLS